MNIFPIALRSRWIIATVAILVAGWWMVPSSSPLKQPATWQRLVEPGTLSAAHTNLETNCAACHTSVTGVEAAKCISCHANNRSLLQRQPTSFHAGIDRCTPCHREHQGTAHRPTKMDHSALADIGMRQLNRPETGDEYRAVRAMVTAKTMHSQPPHPRITIKESTLNCSACHANQDRHFKLFGRDCAQCHATDRWTIPEFRHPSPSSKDCAQCHQAPPSHYMMHFKMISAAVAKRPHARVDQCFQCHQTTSWPDIVGVGWYKHH